MIEKLLEGDLVIFCKNNYFLLSIDDSNKKINLFSKERLEIFNELSLTQIE